MSSGSTVTLISADGDTFVVDADVTRMSATIAAIVEDAGASEPIPLPNVNAHILAKVVEYLTYHASVAKAAGTSASPDQAETARWTSEFMAMDLGTLFEVILAANYLNVKDLLELACTTVANTVKDKSPEEIREAFGLKNDVTPEEEALNAADQWVFE